MIPSRPSLLICPPSGRSGRWGPSQALSARVMRISIRLSMKIHERIFHTWLIRRHPSSCGIDYQLRPKSMAPEGTKGRRGGTPDA